MSKKQVAFIIFFITLLALLADKDMKKYLLYQTVFSEVYL